MSDRYQVFANSALGRMLIRNLGLPAPLALDRFDPAKPLVNGPVLLGAAPGSELVAPLSLVLKNIHAEAYAGAQDHVHRAAADAGLNLRMYNTEDKGQKFKAFVFDATGIQNSDQLVELYNFFHPIARQLLNSGRVLVIGRTPELCTSPKHATAQRALEGLTRAIGKEFKKGITDCP